MSDSDHKQGSRSGADRSSKRSRGRGESKPDAKPKQQGEPQAAKPAEDKDAAAPTGGLDESGKMSSLLETTGEDVKQLLKAADDASKSIREAAQGEASDSGRRGQGGEADTGSLVGRINREVQQVLETADDAADKIREEARAEARQVVAEARRRAESVTKRQMDRVSEMTDRVLGELTTVQGQLQRLQSAYAEALKTMDADLASDESAVWDTKQKGENGEVESEAESDAVRRRLGKRTRQTSAQEPEGISEGARLLALQQMMAGVDPEIIERRLRTEFNVEDPKPILDWMGLHGGPRKPTPKSK